MFAVTERYSAVERSVRVSIRQAHSPQNTCHDWLRRSARGLAAVAALLSLLCLATRQEARAQTFTSLHSFDFSDGASPYGRLVMDSSGNLYGTARYGGSAYEGVVFKLDPSGVVTILNDFDWYNGAQPHAGLTMGPSGVFYGTTYNGGAYGQGIVFMLTASPGTESVLRSLTGSYGAYPYAGLIMDSSDNFYGTAAEGGTGLGVVFKLDPAGNETVLHEFTGGADGVFPYAGLIMDSSGNLYGTTEGGGSGGYGTVFKINSSGVESILYNFTGGADGAFPHAGLVRDPAGNLYGTASAGGSAGVGTVFEISASGAFSLVHTFAGSDGATPYAGLVRDSSGNLYGATFGGGSAGDGTVFKIDSSGHETVLHSFHGNDGSQPHSSLMIDSSGENLYGTTTVGGAGDEGTVFKIALAVPFSYFSAKLDTTSGPPPGFQLKADFTQGGGAPAIDPVAQGMTLTVGPSYTLTIPPDAFSVTNNGWWVYSGTIQGVSLQVRLSQTGTASYEMQIDATGVDLSSIPNPVRVTLTLGSNNGTTAVNQ